MSPASHFRHQRGDFVSQFGLFLFLVVFPVTFTAVVPRYTLELRRDDQGVNATVSAHALLVVPYWRQHEHAVTRVELEFDQGERVGYNTQLSESENRVNRRGRSEDSAVIHFIGDDDGASAMIELGLAEPVLAQSQKFLDDPGQASFSTSFMAHRVLGLYVAGPFCLLVLLYLVLLSLAVTRRVLGRPYWPFDV